jgi:hypothetical protein
VYQKKGFIMFLEYGVNEYDELVHIDQSGRGLTDLTCPYCSGRLLARKGSEKIHHFAHAGETCREVASRDDSAFTLPLYDKFDLGLSQKELVVLYRNFYFDLVRGEKGMSINDSRYGALYTQYSDRANELISHREDIEERLKIKGFLYWNDFAGRSGDYQFTQLGKVPVGAATLEKFAEIQDRQLTDRHKELEEAVETAWISQHSKPNPDYLTVALADLNIYRAQLRRVFSASLYFLEITHSAGTLYKVGISNRSIEERIEELRRDLSSHLSGAKIAILRQLKHRGAIEFYFKHRYRHQQHKLGSLTEYFAFESRTKILSDLTKLGDYTLDEFMQRVIDGKPSPTDARIIEEKERLIAEDYQKAVSQARSQATKVGMQRAAEQGIHVGRPGGSKEDNAKFLTKHSEVVKLLGQGMGIREISRETGIAVNTIRKVKAALN